MAHVKNMIERLFSWFPPYRALLGGYRYYGYSRERKHSPTSFRACGKEVRISENVIIRAPERLCIGDGCWIGHDCELNAIGGIYLGNYCALAARTTILSVDHEFRQANHLPFGDTRLVKPVRLDDYVWIGMNASILPGVRIGEGAIVGLGAVVPRDVPSRAIVVGNPARIVGYRDKEHFERLKSEGKGRPSGRLCFRLYVPPEIQEKHGELLAILGFDTSAGNRIFEFHRPEY